MKKKSHPLFLGISHIGQVFSIGWSEKFGKCSVFDFNKKQLANFSKGRVTQEETNLKKYRRTACKPETKLTFIFHYPWSTL